MSAETLRRAAALMRERAEGPFVDAASWRHDVDVLLEVSDEIYTLAASWHPAVALAVADWLDSLAAELEARAFYIEHPDLPPNTFHALTVARAYLGESA